MDLPQARADENADLDRIPEMAEPATEPGAPPATERRSRWFLENALTGDAYRGNFIVPPPHPPRTHWQERLSLDGRQQWNWAEGLSFTYSGRFNFLAEDDVPFPTHQNIRHDLREGFLTWEPVQRSYLDLGRVNLKQGAAVGFNPTDFFKTRAVVDRTSQDPSVLRENRLGTFMLRAQHIAEQGAVSIAYAPKLYDPSPIYAANNLPSFDPMLDRTNAAHRLLIKGNLDLVGDLSPELMFYQEGSQSALGANVTHGIGNQVVIYGEWAGRQRASLIEEAFRYGQRVGTLPLAAPRVLPGDRGRGFEHDTAIGGSYTTESRITFNLEYHLHQAGFDAADWRRWFTSGGANASSAAITGQLWYIRSYALDQQELVTRQSVFLRAAWTDAFVRNLDLTGLVDTSLYDGSSFLQLTASYNLSNLWTIGAIASGSLGGRHSERGSLAQDAALTVKAVRYF